MLMSMAKRKKSPAGRTIPECKEQIEETLSQIATAGNGLDILVGEMGEENIKFMGNQYVNVESLRRDSEGKIIASYTDVLGNKYEFTFMVLPNKVSGDWFLSQ